MNKIILFALLSFCFIFWQTAQACPCGKGYKYYYVIVESGAIKEEVIQRAEKFSTQLGHKFVSKGATLEARLKECDKKFDQCMVLISSEDELIGKETQKKTFAAAYSFRSYDTKENKKKANMLFKEVRIYAKAAYLKSFEACACE